jgi:hypothetical protein
MKLMIAVILSSLFIMGSAFAQGSQCMPTDAFDKMAFERFGESKVWMGFPKLDRNDSKVLVLYENKKTRSWTMVVLVTQDNMTCYIASGDDFIYIEPKEPLKKGTNM